MKSTLKAKWSKFNQELKEKLKDYKYSYEETWKIVGCGYKTLQRYMDRELVDPLKVSDEWLFDQERVEKVKFIYELRKHAKVPVEFSAVLFDYMKTKKSVPDYQELLNRMPEWALYEM